MENSILKSTKKILGLDEDYTAFDLDIITHINSTFSILNQLGIGPSDGFSIEDANTQWEDYGLPERELKMVRTDVYLKVRLLFDPPTVSFLIDLANDQIKEHEHRLVYFHENFIV